MIRERENLEKLSVDECILSTRMMLRKRDLKALFSFVVQKLL